MYRYQQQPCFSSWVWESQRMWNAHEGAQSWVFTEVLVNVVMIEKTTAQSASFSDIHSPVESTIFSVSLFEDCSFYSPKQV